MSIYCNVALPSSALFHPPLLCCVLLFSVFLCSRLERGSTRTNQLQKALCPFASENIFALFPPFVCLPPTCTQHEHESFPLSSAFNNASSLCPSPHTRIPWRGAVNFSLYVAHSLSTTPSCLCLTPLFFICHFLINKVSLSQSPSFSSSIPQIGDLTQHPHYSDFIRQQLQSRPQSNVLVEGTISTAAVSGTQG